MVLVLATYKPSGLVDGSTLPSWVKLPVETHEPNTAGTPPSKDSSTSAHSSTSTMPKPTTTPQNPSDNDIIMTSNSISAVGSSTQYPSSTLSMLTTAGTTATPTTAATSTTTTADSVEDGNAPLNMSNYKEGMLTIRIRIYVIEMKLINWSFVCVKKKSLR